MTGGGSWKIQSLGRNLCQMVKQELKGKCMESWEDGIRTVRSAAKAVLGETSGNGKQKMETWWWYDEVQKVVLEKKEMKKLRDANRIQENIKRYKANKTVKNYSGAGQGSSIQESVEKLGLKRRPQEGSEDSKTEAQRTQVMCTR